MEINEANKIIAEYMGWYKEDHLNHGLCWNHPDIEDRSVLDFCPNFKSLDALIPVWEKLNNNGVMLIFSTFNGTHYGWNIETRIARYHEFETVDHKEYDRNIALSEALCLATAKAIQELEN